MFYSFVVCGVNEGEWQEIEDWSSEQPFLSSTCYPHILRTPELHYFRPSLAFAHSFAQSGSSEMIIQSSPTFLHHSRHSGVPLPAFSSVACSSCFSGLPQSNADNVFPDETSESFFSCLTPNTADDTYTLSDPFLSADCIWQPGDDDREDKMIFYSQQSFLGDCVSCSSSDILYVGLTESQRNREDNQLEINVSHQHMQTELGTGCQIKPEEEMSKDRRQQYGAVYTGQMLTDVRSVPAENAGKGKCSAPHDTRCGCFHSGPRNSFTWACLFLIGGTLTQLCS